MKKLIRILALSLVLIMALGVVPALAASSYGSYTYSKDGWSMLSPDAYSPQEVVDNVKMGVKTKLNAPTDLETDEDGNVYIADAGNDRILVLDRYYKYKFQLKSFVNGNGIPDGLKNPNGLFVGTVRGEKLIYVADTDNKRLVVFDRDTGAFKRVIEEPESDVFPPNNTYRPVSVAVDSTGAIYVVSSACYMGVIALNADGDFTCFVGAQKVTISAFDKIWRNFQTQEQKDSSEQYISVEFNNIVIDKRGFIYVSTSAIDPASQQSAVKSKGADYSPVKKLNVSGDDIMKRTGFFGFGEVMVMNAGATTNKTAPTGASVVVDIALGPENTWSMIDQKRSKIFTYDEYGNLLFVFGDLGTQLGNLKNASAITYQDEKILVLDKSTAAFTVFNRTEYGDILINAIANQNNRKYDSAKEDWEGILQRNNNFDAAYIGIGKSLYRSGKWTESMDFFKSAYDTTNYSNSFKMYRKEWVSKYIYIIPIVIIAVCVAGTKFFGYAGKLNKKVAISGKKRTFWQEIIYANHLIFHPFDGFWDLKHEKRGSVRGALFYLAFAIVTFTYQGAGTAYVFNPNQKYSSIITQIISLVVPLMLWVISNWCLTTLFEGEGSFKDIFIATCYALAPLPLLIIPSVIITNFLTVSEGSIVTLLQSIAWIWVGILVFLGTMVTHDYGLFGNALTCLGTIVGMVFIMFIAILFTTMLTNVVGFITSIVTELSYRV